MLDVDGVSFCLKAETATNLFLTGLQREQRQETDDTRDAGCLSQVGIVMCSPSILAFTHKLVRAGRDEQACEFSDDSPE